MPVETPATTAAPTLEGLDEFLELENKIHRVADALGEARDQRDRALASLVPLQTALEQAEQARARAEQARAQTEGEMVALRRERNEIRERVGRLVQLVQQLEKG